VTTANATNKVTAVPEDGATVALTVNGNPLENETSASWSSGENTLVITVTKGNQETVYTVTVTKQ